MTHWRHGQDQDLDLGLDPAWRRCPLPGPQDHLSVRPACWGRQGAEGAWGRCLGPVYGPGGE